MAELCYEFASWPASEDYQKDQSTVASALDVLKVKTPYRIWSGLGTWPDERPTYWSIVAWETSATHAAFKTDLPNYNKMMAGFASSFAEKENPTLLLIYTHFGIDPSAVFDTPATAVTVVKSKEGISLEKAKAVLDNTCQALSATSESPKVAWATVESQPDLFVLAEGWETDISSTTRDLTELLNNFTVDTPTALVRLNKVQ